MIYYLLIFFYHKGANVEDLIRNGQIRKMLTDISALDFILTIITILAVISFIVAVSIKAYKVMEKYRKLKNESEKKEEKFENYEKSIKILTEMSEQQKDDISRLDEKMNTVFAMLIELRKHDDSNKRANLKDRISQSYRYHHSTRTITRMDIETLEGLIASYESCGGTNSFVHEVVQKEMYTWEIVENEAIDKEISSKI